ncbi:MAG: response regulator transcription factor [Actinomycetota bacterium]|nr:response regulator transcription factor [Actinomycetota bacterium]
MTHVLVVEDDHRIASFIAKGLGAEGYGVSVAPSTEKAMGIFAAGESDLSLVLLDLGLPGADGIELLGWIRRRNTTVPVLIVTARQGTADTIAGLDAGANDYITKPFAFDELLARIRAALRNAGQETSSVLTVDDLSFDLITKQANRAGRSLDLSPREWSLLEMFMRNPNQILSRVQILNRVWNYGFDPESNIVDVYVGYLRRKLNLPGLPRLIQTVRGVGYRLVPR